MKVLAIALALLLVAAAAISCSLISATQVPNTKLRIANAKLNNEAEAMVIIAGEAWNDDTVPISATITGTLLDADGKAITSGDQTLPIIQPGKGVPFNIAFSPNTKVAKHSVVVKSIDRIESQP